MKNIINLFLLLGLFVASLPSYAVPPYFGISVEENLSFTELSCLATAEQALKNDGFEKTTATGSTIFAAYRNKNPYKYKAFIKCLTNVGVIMVVVAAPSGAKKKAIALMEKVKQGYVGKVMAKSNTTCDAQAYVIDKDVQGLNVRQTPKNGKVIARILKDTVVHIVGAEDGWLKINSWYDLENSSKTTGKTGWIYSKLVATSLRGYGEKGINAYMAPSNFSKSKGKFKQEEDIVKILDCQSKWLYVEGVLMDGSSVNGWLEPEGQCPSPFTTCP